MPSVQRRLNCLVFQIPYKVLKRLIDQPTSDKVEILSVHQPTRGHSKTKMHAEKAIEMWISRRATHEKGLSDICVKCRFKLVCAVRTG